MSDVTLTITAGEAERLSLHEAGCPDGGTCHHDCKRGCFRVEQCAPLSGVFDGDAWPPMILNAPALPDDLPLKWWRHKPTGKRVRRSHLNGWDWFADGPFPITVRVEWSVGDDMWRSRTVTLLDGHPARHCQHLAGFGDYRHCQPDALPDHWHYRYEITKETP